MPFDEVKIDQNPLETYILAIVFSVKVLLAVDLIIKTSKEELVYDENSDSMLVTVLITYSENVKISKL